MTTDADQPTGTPPMRRLHPLTPFVRGWKYLAGLLAVGTSQGLDALLSARAAPTTSARDIATILGVLVAAALGAVFLAWLSWRTTRFGIDAGDLRIDSGVLNRQSRRIRLDRLQAVDVVRPLLARALGLAELRLEVAGGASTEAPLAYLSEQDAHVLRAELLALAAGLGSDTPEAPQHPLHTVSGAKLLASSLLQLPLLVGAVLAIGLGVLTIAIGETRPLFFALPALASAATAFGRQFVANYNFTLADSPDGLRISRGLLETRAQTVPPGRVQAVKITEPLLWRRFPGWARLEVEIAGYSTGGSGGAAAAVLLPVASRSECLALLAMVLPGADLDAIATRGVPRRAGWLAPLSRRILAAGADDRYFVTRRGVLDLETAVLPHERIQSVRMQQGPIQRRLRLATVTLDTTPGPVTVVAEHRDAAEAWQLVQLQARRALTARAAARPERWMQPGYGEGGGDPAAVGPLTEEAEGAPGPG